jgi:hypothetical protein
MPVAVNCWVSPAGTDVKGGDTSIVRSTAGRMVTSEIPSVEVVGSVAVIVEAPVATAVTSPWEPAAFETVASDVSDDAQVTESVMFSVVAFE